MSFQSGDVVKLKSGSPKMTVEIVNQDGVKCVWFDNANSKTATFPPEALLRLFRKGQTSIVSLVR